MAAVELKNARQAGGPGGDGTEKCATKLFSTHDFTTFGTLTQYLAKLGVCQDPVDLAGLALSARWLAGLAHGEQVNKGGSDAKTN